MVSKEDIELTYNYAPFLKAVNKMSGSFDNFSKKMNKQSTKTEKVSTKKNKTMGKGFMKLAFLASLVVAGVMLIKKVIQSIPEIGKTFAIAGGIIKRNLLWPLRKELIPYLQKMLDWVRDHRSMFVKWGVAIVKVFKVIKAVFMLGVKIVSTFVGAFKNAIKDLFDISAKNISKVFNLLIFKVITLIMLLEIKLRPLAKALGKIFAEVIKVVWAFVESFGKAMLNVFKDMNAFEDIESIFENLRDIFREIQPLIKPLGVALGEAFGEMLAESLKIILATLKGIKATITSITGLVAVAEGKKGWKDYGQEVDKSWGFSAKKEAMKKLDEEWRLKLEDKKKKDLEKKKTSNNINVLMDVKLNVTEGNAQAAGENFTGGIENEITNILMDSEIGEGNK